MEEFDCVDQRSEAGSMKSDLDVHFPISTS